MSDFWTLHGKVFMQEPQILAVILIWGVWYMTYKRRAALHEIDPRRRHEHRKRVVIGGLATLWGFVALPGITADYEAQQVRQQLPENESAPVATGPVIAPLPDQIGVETVYDTNDWFLASLLGSMNSNADEAGALITRFTGLKDGMSVESVDLTNITKQEQEKHDDTMSILDLMRCVPYAAHGYRFQRTLVNQFFLKFDWYHPKIDDAAAVEAKFTPAERKNIQMIADFERRHWTP
ncbi:hypothetical protein CCAX7_65790 [Capsulimonas corticalis]|uniref:Uncharacterized protein n=1 Tax=Capsulimonas corticalis TaxID=2219043 RepID=A0A402CR53_9BACT|nr:YARHG domain-containing protein [Capsulimonas corticalis]BDI34528.1 hypothetical protein CCAX7_65790 [Capsulimonas corticalis]